MLQEETKPEIYRITFSLEEIKPLVLSEIDRAQDINNPMSLSRLRFYEQYHTKLEEYLKNTKNKKPSKAEKLAYIILLSYPKKYIIEANSFDDFRLFKKKDKEESDFKIFDKIDMEYNEFDEFDDHIDCICSKSWDEGLREVTRVENKLSFIMLYVGSECIKKYKIVSEEEIKIMNEINAKNRERKKEIKECLPIGYYEEERKNEKLKKKQEKMQEKREKEQPKIDSGNYRRCYLCDNSLMNIRNDRNKRICDKCIKNDDDFRGTLIMSSNFGQLINNIKYECKRYDCNNCDTEFISLLSNNEYLCKKCVKYNKILSCKICKEKVLLAIDSNDIYCEDCEIRLINCIDCNEVTIRYTDDSTRCKTCQLCYDNKIILQKCCDCEEDFVRKQKEIWRTYCEPCFKNIEFPECICSKKMVQRTVKKEGVNKGRKFYVCKEGKCKEFIWD